MSNSTLSSLPLVWSVDDDRLHQLIMKRLFALSEKKVELVSFLNGEEAYLRYQEAAVSEPESLPDLILLDLNMPLMDGWEFLEKLSPSAAFLVKRPIIYIVSSSVDDADIGRSRTYPEVSGYLSKPVLADALNNLMKEFSQALKATNRQ